MEELTEGERQLLESLRTQGVGSGPGFVRVLLSIIAKLESKIAVLDDALLIARVGPRPTAVGHKCDDRWLGEDENGVPYCPVCNPA